MQSLIVLLAVILGTTAYAPVMAQEESHRWTESYDTYKAHIRDLDSGQRIECEKILYEVLKSIDENRYCANDNECTLVNQEPFGPVVPVRLDASATILAKMNNFRESCNDETYESHFNPEMQHEPVCWNNKCMVKSKMK